MERVIFSYYLKKHDYTEQKWIFEEHYIQAGNFYQDNWMEDTYLQKIGGYI